MLKHTVLALSLSSPSLWAATSRVEILKEQIIEVARSYAGQDDKLVEARQTLDPLVKKLASYNQATTAAEQLPELVGAWKEIWSDEREPTPPGFSIDRSQVYQVIDANGFFYNFADTTTPFGQGVGILRGIYAPREGVALNIEFTASKFRVGPLAPGADLTALVADVESEVPSASSPDKPNGPVGVKGILENVYVDKDFRVSIEKDPELNVRALFVLEKTPVVIK